MLSTHSPKSQSPQTSSSIIQRATSFPFVLRKSSSVNQTSSQEASAANLLYRNEGKLGIGDVNRFTIDYYDFPGDHKKRIQSDEHGRFLWLRVRNEEMNMLRPFYLTGPFTFYIDVTPYNYKRSQKFDEEIQFNPDIKPGKSFKAKLYISDNSKIKEGHYSWTVDILSQITLTTKFVIYYSLRIGYDKKLLKAINIDEVFKENEVLLCQKLSTEEIWNMPPKHADKPVHLVVFTHGIFSNTGCDMLFMKDELQKVIDQNKAANVIIRGYNGNIGKSEKGIRYLGKRVGNFVLDLVDNSPFKIDRISFVGHSLGGPVQAYAIFHISYVRSDFFLEVVPINLLFLACPMLGVLSEFPMYLSFALDIGMLGATGRDLTLRHKFPKMVKKSNEKTTKEYRTFTSKPILEQILLGASHEIYESFLNRTTYANAVNDGIVPLRTAALLYLDWRSLDQVEILKEKDVQAEEVTEENDLQEDQGTRPRQGTVSEVPPDETEVKGTREMEKAEQSKKTSSKMLLASNSSFFDDLKRNKKRNKVKKYLRTQTSSKSKDTNNPSYSSEPSSGITEEPPSSSGLEEPQEELKEDTDGEIHIPPAASTILSAANVVSSPAPSSAYLTNPEKRPKTIFHDKYYNFSDLPEPHYSKNTSSGTDTKLRHFVSGSKKAIQERMARSWHWHMEWRKVLVTLRPDAHNNISVRRKFVNAWGWDVIDHLVQNHFGEEAIKRENEHVESARRQKRRG